MPGIWHPRDREETQDALGIPPDRGGGSFETRSGREGGKRLGPPSLAPPLWLPKSPAEMRVFADRETGSGNPPSGYLRPEAYSVP